MLLGFKRRFAGFVEDGSKTHTIRGLRSNPPRVGETCHCYVDPRQKTMRLLGRWPCVRIETIKIYERGDGSFGVLIDDEELSPDEQNALAWRDGFRDFGESRAFEVMMRYWMGLGRNQEPRPFVFDGHVIHWKRLT